MHGNVCKAMLLINTAWDFLSAAAIWGAFCTKDVLLLEQPPPLLPQKNQTKHRGVLAMRLLPQIAEDLVVEEEARARSGGSSSIVEETPSLTRKIADMHTAMWSRYVDSHNHAACMLMAWWVLTLGCMRLLGALMWGEWLILAMVSYGIEAAAFMGEGLKSTMAPRKACPASLFSMLCLLICATTYFQ